MSELDAPAHGPHLQIGEVADRTSLSIKTIRHYDEVGLVVPSARSAGGFRLYTTDDIDRLFAIRRMKPLGFTLDEMRQVLAALATLEDASASASDRSDAKTFLAECHTRAADACTKLGKQLDYARELTSQLAGFAAGQ